ncbi:AAA family ATPase [Burkholderia gladioli]|uniref:AAA family ATPase n=1 Tax=Burkholderia gladioli TaxID=28095 RepID=UPI0007C688EE|nr:ATP-binding protein [Burkholderia gladioli]
MKIVYVSKNTKRRDNLLEAGEDCIVLSPDNWDDFDYKTTFKTRCKIGGQSVKLDSIKILIAGQKISARYLDALIEQGWGGEFPIPKADYISLPSALTFYQQLDGRLGSDKVLEVAKLLNDASLKVWIERDADSEHLANSEGFRYSLLRERGAQSAYHNGWKVFDSSSINIGDVKFRFRDPFGASQTLDLNFDAKNLLPHDIHVVIGPNGAGKTQTLLQLVEHWLDVSPGDDRDCDVGFLEPTNFNQLVVVSYSPFEKFPIDSKSKGNRKDEDVYKYFGLRGREQVFDKHGAASTRIRLSQTRPKQNAAHSLLACVSDDQEYGEIKDWSAKIATLTNVLRTAIDFDYVAIAVKSTESIDQFFDQSSMFFIDKTLEESDAVLRLPTEGEDINEATDILIPIAEDRVDALVVDLLKRHVRPGKGIVFLKDGEAVELSSGQRLFSYVVFNILGAIRRNSLILIDEPELFLHPTLEIAFLSMLKKILVSYRSKALIATHSLIAVRELPRSCVHVYDRTNEGLYIKHPPFETFGGDIQRISSYAFGDKSVSKPFESWISEKLAEYGSAEKLIDALGDDINEEMIIQISAMGARRW